jgi:hypothetical protein
VLNAAVIMRSSKINTAKYYPREKNSHAQKNPIALAIIVVVFVVIVAIQPSEFRVVRSASISAPAPVVFAQVNDFHKWEAWNPWGKIDPAMKQTYEGAPAGAGAIYTWTGNKEVGEGRMTITESRPSELIRIKMEFFKPFAGTSIAESPSNRKGIKPWLHGAWPEKTIS